MEEVRANAKVQLTHVPFKGNADLLQALLGGHVMAQSDASGWDKFVDGGQMRLLVTFGEKRTKRWPSVPTAQELGYRVISTSPYGFVGPKGMDPASRRCCTTPSARRWTIRSTWSCSTSSTRTPGTRSGDEYAKWARETFARDKLLIERLGLAAKS
jgi:hypothetical protein